MSDLSAEGLFKRFDVSGLVWDELTADQRIWWEAQAKDFVPVPAIQIAAIAKPGDTLLVGFDHQMSDAEFQVMCDLLRPLKDRLGIEIVLIEGASSMIVVRPDLDVNGAPIRPSETVLGAFKGSVCPYTQSHTHEFCGYDACRER